jgi:hypothetical protein
MSLIVQIAEDAGVPIEGVVRVLTRQPVGDSVKQRVLEALEDLGPADRELVRRAATLTRPLVENGADPSAEEEPDARVVLTRRLEELAQTAGGPGEPGVEQSAGPAPAPADADFADAVRELSRAMSALGASVRELRRDGDSERAARVEDLALLVDLVVSGWKTVDRRLGRLERLLERSSPAPPTER